MNISPLKFREFGADAAVNAISIPAKDAKTFLPGGRTRGAVPPPPPPTFSEEQLKAAERDGYKKGFLEGTEEGRKQKESEQAAVDKQLSETVEKFASSVQPLFEEYKKLALQLSQDLPKVALSMARKVAGTALDEHAKGVIEDMAIHCVQVMIAEPKLAVTVNDKLAPALEAKLKKLAETLQSQGEITVVGDPSMKPEDCRVEWEQGACVRDTDKLWKSVEEAVNTVAAAAKHQTENNLNAIKATLLEAQTQTDKKE